MHTIADIPVEVFIDNLLPLLPASDLLSLGSTNRFFYLLASDDTFWKRKIEADFNFTSTETARTSGWKFLYSRFSHPRVYVWGAKSHGRLGILPPKLPRTIVYDGIPYPVQLKFPGIRVVSLVAGGWSFQALDSEGSLWVWGQLDGLNIALRSDGFSEPCMKAEQPLRLRLPVSIRTISCGRLHSAALDKMSNVWSFSSWGRPVRLISSLLDKSIPETTPVQVECGWGFTSVLTQSGDVLIYWPISDGVVGERISVINRQLDDTNNPMYNEARALPATEEPGIIPCYTFEVDTDPVRLPSIPFGSLPELRGTGRTDQQLAEQIKLVKIAGMEDYLIGLTNQGHVLRYRIVVGRAISQMQWEYVPKFSEVEKVREHPVFSDNGGTEASGLKPPRTMCITHISAHFQTFVAYSTGEDSIVLIGKSDIDLLPLVGDDSNTPTIIPELQNQSVISVVLGDYHYGALTSTGKLLTWGAFSSGALGLGEPTDITPGHPGGFASENELQVVRSTRMMRFTPHDVHVPTEVRFDHGAKERKQRFCFAAAAAGWHMGALVVDLEKDEEPAEEESVDMPGAFPAGPAQALQPPTPMFGQIPFLGNGLGRSAFRIGFAGRGMRGLGRGGGAGS